MPDSYLKRLVDSFEARTDHVAMRIVGDDSQVYTFGDSLLQIRSIAHRLELEGVAFGDRVALIGENHPCWAIAYLGILYRGAVCVPIDPHGETETLKNFLENSEAKIAFVGEEVEEKIHKIAERLGRELPVVVWPASDRSACCQRRLAGPTAPGSRRSATVTIACGSECARSDAMTRP